MAFSKNIVTQRDNRIKEMMKDASEQTRNIQELEKAISEQEIKVISLN